jgi:hypothetical protein
MAEAPKSHEFQVAITGLDLAPEHVERINQAVKAAVMTEIANLGLPGGVSIFFPRPPFLGLILRPNVELE